MEGKYSAYIPSNECVIGSKSPTYYVYSFCCTKPLGTPMASLPLSTLDADHVRKDIRLSLPAQLQCSCFQGRGAWEQSEAMYGADVGNKHNDSWGGVPGVESQGWSPSGGVPGRG